MNDSAAVKPNQLAAGDVSRTLLVLAAWFFLALWLGVTGKLVTGGLPIGLFPGVTVSMETYDIPQGSTVVLYTDGVTEAESPVREHFGMARLCGVVAAKHGETARGIHEAIRGALTAFTGECQPSDDSTLVVLKT